MKIEVKQKALVSNLNLKFDGLTIKNLDAAINGGNKIIKRNAPNVSYNRASIVRDIVDAAIRANLEILTIEDRSFTIKDLIKMEFPNFEKIKNISDAIGFSLEIKDDKLFKFLNKITINTVKEMKKNIETYLKVNKGDYTEQEYNDLVEKYEESLGEYNPENRDFEEYNDTDYNFSISYDINSFIEDNGLDLDGFKKTFCYFIANDKELANMIPLYFFDKYTFEKCNYQLNFLIKEWCDYLMHYTEDEDKRYLYKDFENKIKSFVE